MYHGLQWQTAFFFFIMDHVVLYAGLSQATIFYFYLAPLSPIKNLWHTIWKHLQEECNSIFFIYIVVRTKNKYSSLWRPLYRICFGQVIFDNLACVLFTPLAISLVFISSTPKLWKFEWTSPRPDSNSDRVISLCADYESIGLLIYLYAH